MTKTISVTYTNSAVQGGHLILMRGLPGSGKSTHAQSLNADVVVSRDELRKLFKNTEHNDHKREMVITDMICSCVKRALEQHMSVVVDACHLPSHFMKPLIKLAHECKAHQITIIQMVENVDVCATRRAEIMGKEVVYNYYEHYKSTLAPYASETAVTDYLHQLLVPKESAQTRYTPKYPTMCPCIICDIDGTLSNLNGRDPYLETDVMYDLVHEHIKGILVRYQDTHNIIIMTGRTKKCEQDTKAWLKLHRIPYAHLYMRNVGDRRTDATIKRLMLNDVNEHFGPVEFVLEDRNSVVDMWRALGLKCLQVAPGDF